jgi:transcriptional regulator with XRE-family HTH domain
LDRAREVVELLRELEDAGVKQTQNVCAGALSVTKSTVSRWARGTVAVPDEKLVELRRVVKELVRLRSGTGGQVAEDKPGEVVFLVSHRWRTQDFVPLSPDQLKVLFPWGLGAGPLAKERE